ATGADRRPFRSSCLPVLTSKANNYSMALSTPDGHLSWYVINYFGHLMTKPEGLAYRTVLVQQKAKHSRAPERLLEYGTNNPDALALMTEGIEQFMRRVRDRILRDHRNKVFLNYCPRCGGLAMTPKAQQCCWCFYDWHPREEGSPSR